MNLKLYELAQICRGVRERLELDPLYLVLVSSGSEEPRFIPVSESSQFDKGLRQALVEEDYQALGLLGWEQQGEYYQARKKPFPWIAKDPQSNRRFDQICDMGAETVRKLVDPDCLH